MHMLLSFIEGGQPQKLNQNQTQHKTKQKQQQQL